MQIAEGEIFSHLSQKDVSSSLWKAHAFIYLLKEHFI